MVIPVGMGYNDNYLISSADFSTYPLYSLVFSRKIQVHFHCTSVMLVCEPWNQMCRSISDIENKGEKVFYKLKIWGDKKTDFLCKLKQGLCKHNCSWGWCHGGLSYTINRDPGLSWGQRDSGRALFLLHRRQSQIFVGLFIAESSRIDIQSYM